MLGADPRDSRALSLGGAQLIGLLGGAGMERDALN